MTDPEFIHTTYNWWTSLVREQTFLKREEFQSKVKTELEFVYDEDECGCDESYGTILKLTYVGSYWTLGYNGKNFVLQWHKEGEGNSIKEPKHNYRYHGFDEFLTKKEKVLIKGLRYGTIQPKIILKKLVDVALNEDGIGAHTLFLEARISKNVQVEVRIMLQLNNK